MKHRYCSRVEHLGALIPEQKYISATERRMYMYDGVFFHRYLGCQGIQRGVRLEKLIVVVVFKSLRGSDLPSLFVFVCLALLVLMIFCANGVLVFCGLVLVSVNSSKNKYPINCGFCMHTTLRAPLHYCTATVPHLVRREHGKQSQ